MLPLSSRLGLGGPAGDLGSLLTIAESPAYAMVGAAAVLSALYRAPLTGSLLMFELTKVGKIAEVYFYFYVQVWWERCLHITHRHGVEYSHDSGDQLESGR